MRIAMTLLTVALAVSAGACKKKEKAPDTTTTTTTTTGSAGSAGSADMTGSAGSGAMAGSDMAGSGAMAGSDMAAGSGAGSGSADTMMAKHAGNCPSTVLGSTTTDAVKGKDVLVTITSTDKDAVVAIQLRTDQLIKDRMAKKGGGGGGGGGSGSGGSGSGGGDGNGHDQKGTHGGSIGLCPVHIPEGATAKAKHEKNGVVITITPKDKPDELKTEIDGRIMKAADWVKANIKEGDKGNMGGVGGATNKEGANHSGQGDAKGIERKKNGGAGSGGGDGGGGGGGKGTGGGGGKGAGGGGAGSAKK